MDDMAPYTLLLLLALVTSISSQGTQIGGFMTHFPKGQNRDGSFQVDLRFRETYMGSCDLSNKWTCLEGDCGEIATAVIETVFENEGICQNEGILAVTKQTTAKFVMGLKEQNLRASVDLGTRSDTGAPNNPARCTVLPEIRFAQDCAKTIRLVSDDQDGDTVKCKFTEDCVQCSEQTNFILNGETCELRYDGNGKEDVNAFEVTVEEFSKQEIKVVSSDGLEAPLTPSTPLSERSLKFSVTVTAPAGICTEGEVLPALTAPTPADGAVLQATVDQPLEIGVSATAQTIISGFMVSGRSGTSITSITPSEDGSESSVTLIWTPAARDAGDRFPLCFAAEIQSETRQQGDMRCAMINVAPEVGGDSPDDGAGGDSPNDGAGGDSSGDGAGGDSPGDGAGGDSPGDKTVICSPTSMTITADRSIFGEITGASLTLIDVECTATTTETQVIASTDLDACGTEFEEDNENVVFKNSIKLVHDGGVITRNDDIKLQFSCTYPKKEIVSTLFRALKLSEVFDEDGFGKFSFQFAFFESSTFQTKVDTNTKPLEVNLQEMIFIQIKATAAENTELFVESCRATPEDNPENVISYSIIENGCIMDSTVQEFESRSREYRIGIKAFGFIGDHDEVYISCSVILCIMGKEGTRCTKGCIESNEMRKRSVAGETARHNVVLGPLRLKRSTDDKGLRVFSAPSVTINMNLLCVTGLIAVALVCSVVAYKIKKSHNGYQQLPVSVF